MGDRPRLPALSLFSAAVLTGMQLCDAVLVRKSRRSDLARAAPPHEPQPRWHDDLAAVCPVPCARGLAPPVPGGGGAQKSVEARMTEIPPTMCGGLGLNDDGVE